MNEATRLNDRNGTAPSKAYHRRAVAPSVDVFENTDELLVIADVPGVPNDGIDLQVQNDTLTLTARRGDASADLASAPALVREYDEADFTATFRIPAGIDTAAIVAETKHGTLVVRLPKAAAAKARKIVVRPRSGD
jgi:HSP20 family molecular chaperone IbpA